MKGDMDGVWVRGKGLGNGCLCVNVFRKMAVCRCWGHGVMRLGMVSMSVWSVVKDEGVYKYWGHW